MNQRIWKDAEKAQHALDDIVATIKHRGKKIYVNHKLQSALKHISVTKTTVHNQYVPVFHKRVRNETSHHHLPCRYAPRSKQPINIIDIRTNTRYHFPRFHDIPKNLRLNWHYGDVFNIRNLYRTLLPVNNYFYITTHVNWTANRVLTEEYGLVKENGKWVIKDNYTKYLRQAKQFVIKHKSSHPSYRNSIIRAVREYRVSKGNSSKPKLKVVD